MVVPTHNASNKFEILLLLPYMTKHRVVQSNLISFSPIVCAKMLNEMKAKGEKLNINVIAYFMSFITAFLFLLFLIYAVNFNQAIDVL
jgi:hypothetical protein